MHDVADIDFAPKFLIYQNSRNMRTETFSKSNHYILMRQNIRELSHNSFKWNFSTHLYLMLTVYIRLPVRNLHETPYSQQDGAVMLAQRERRTANSSLV